MKTPVIILFIFLFVKINAQDDAGHFYLHFWHPNFYNPSARVSDSLILVNSFSSWEKPANTGYLNIAGNISVPFSRQKLIAGVNYSSYHEFSYQSKEVGVYLNRAFKFGKNIKISIGLEFGLRSQSYFVKENIIRFPSSGTIEKGYYNGNSPQINGGIGFYWKGLYVGAGCRNCGGSGYHFTTGDFYLDEKNIANTMIQSGYVLQANNKLKIMLGALVKEAIYEFHIDGSFAFCLKDKYYFGCSMRNDFPVDVAFHAGYKWQNFWLLGVFQPKNRYDSAALELAAQLQILKNK